MDDYVGGGGYVEVIFVYGAIAPLGSASFGSHLRVDFSGGQSVTQTTGTATPWQQSLLAAPVSLDGFRLARARGMGHSNGTNTTDAGVEVEMILNDGTFLRMDYPVVTSNGPASTNEIAGKAARNRVDPFYLSSQPFLLGQNLVGLRWRATGISPSGSGETITFSQAQPYQLYLVYDDKDTDGDGLWDSWETIGIPYTGADGVERRYMLDDNGDGISDANPLQKDIFVEVDAMSGRAPSAATFQRVINAFNPPYEVVPAPAGVTGGLPNVKLHIQTNPAHLELPLVNNGHYINGDVGWDDFYFDKGRFFGTPTERASADWAVIRVAKSKAYRYCIFANTFGNTRNSGSAKVGPSADFMVTLGPMKPSPNFGPVWADAAGNPGGDEDMRIGTFMHELGHTLGLSHGGGIGNSTLVVAGGIPVFQNRINYKPNYYSIMNYEWQEKTSLNSAAWGLRFSESALPRLDENDLNEAAGIGAAHGGALARYRVRPPSTCAGFRCHASVPVVCFNLASLGSNDWVDWNGDCVPTPGPLAVDINDFYELESFTGPTQLAEAGTGRCVLEGHDDWENLLYNFRDSQGNPPGSQSGHAGCNYNDVISAFFASNTPPCPADFNGGGLSVQDIFDFLSAWFVADLRADFNGGGLSVQDIFDFLSAWFAGCS